MRKGSGTLRKKRKTKNMAEYVKVAVDAIQDFLLEHDMEVTLVIFDQETWYLAKEKFGELMDTIHIGKETYYDQ